LDPLDATCIVLPDPECEQRSPLIHARAQGRWADLDGH